MKRKLSFFFLIALLIIFSLPYLLSTSFGKPIFTSLLKKELKGDVSIEKIKLSWLGPQYFENMTLSKKDMLAHVEELISNVPFWNLSSLGTSFDLKNGTFSFPSLHGNKIVDVQAHIQGNQIKALGKTPLGGNLSIQGLFISPKHFDITADLLKIPTPLIDQMLDQDQWVYKSLGETINLKGSFFLDSNRGHLAFDLSSPNGKMSLNGSILDQVFTLNQNLTASLWVKDEFIQSILEHLPSNLIQEFHAKNSFTLSIEKDGFQCPIQPFSWDRLHVEKGSLNLGQFRIKSGESLHFLVKLFKDKNFSKNIDVWCTPINYRIDNGVIYMNRMDALLSDSIHLCVWGDIDVQEDNLNMTLGLPSDTLEQSFGIQNLARNYVLKIPVYGSLSSPKFDTGTAIAKVASMATVQQIPTIGGIVNIFTTQDDGNTPQPNRPFPWEN